MKKILIPLSSIVLLLLGWQLLATYIDKPELFPPLSHLLTKLFALVMSPRFFGSVATTIVRGIGGIILSLAAATGMAVLCSRHTLLHELFRPLLSLMRSVPVISFILLALIFLQPESIPLLIAFLTMFPLLSENLTNGMRNLRPELKSMGETFHMRRINYYTQVVYPQLHPFLFSGLASAIGFGWRAIIMGEVLSQCTFGIGSEMKQAQTFIDVPSLMAWTVIAIALSFLFDKVINRLGQVKLPIRYATNATVTVGSGSAITLQSVTKTYGAKEIFNAFSFTFEAGIIYGISAPSGRGKSTLLRLINGSQLPDGGHILVARTQGIPCVFEEPELLPNLTVLENITLLLASIYPREQARERAWQVLELVEMGDLSPRLPRELSYGQQQRVSLARALAYPAPLLLLDEPFKGLDNELTERIALRLLKRQQLSNQTVIFVTHKPEELMLLAHETIKL